MSKIFSGILLVGFIALSTDGSATTEVLKDTLIKQLRTIEANAKQSGIGTAAESLRRSISPSKDIKAKPSDEKMKSALNSLKSAATKTKYANKTFSCKQDYDRCEPKASSWLSGPWSCEVTFATCLAEHLVVAGKK